MKLYILSNHYGYEEVDNHPDYGECDKLNRVIQIRSNQNKDQMIDTIFHELAHAIWDLMGLPEDDDMEEKVCTAMGRGFGSLLRDPRNREYIKYLISFFPEKIKDES